MSALTDQTRTELAADNCEVLRARLAKYEDDQGNPVSTIAEQARDIELLNAEITAYEEKIAAHLQPISDERDAFEASGLKSEASVWHDGSYQFRVVDDGEESFTLGLGLDNIKFEAWRARARLAANAVRMPERLDLPQRDEFESADQYAAAVGESKKWNACLDEVARLNPSRGVPEGEPEWPEYHHNGMGCGLEDRGITDRYEAMQHGWDDAFERCVTAFNHWLSAAPTPAPTVEPAHSDAVKVLPDLLLEAIAVLMLYTRGSASREGVLINDIRALLDGGRS